MLPKNRQYLEITPDACPSGPSHLALREELLRLANRLADLAAVSPLHLRTGRLAAVANARDLAYAAGTTESALRRAVASLSDHVTAAAWGLPTGGKK